VILYGCWTVFKNDTHSDNYHFFPPRGLQVREMSGAAHFETCSPLYREVNGTHLAADSNSFLEKRRRGLVRFANTLVRHPVLNQEQLVVMFLTVPTVSQSWFIFGWTRACP